MPKVAVIISGQLRNWKIALENQKWFFSTTGDEVDYFVHTVFRLLHHYIKKNSHYFQV